MKLDPTLSAAESEVASTDTDASTRDRVLKLIVEKGPVSAAQLGTELELTAAAVRRHLDAMATQNIIEVKNVSSQKRGAGRPSRRYVLSSAGQESLGNDYLTLVRLALKMAEADDSAAPLESGIDQQMQKAGMSYSAAHSADEDAAVDRKLAQAYFADFEHRYGEELADVEDLGLRTEKLSKLLHEDGFAGFVRRVGRDSAVLSMQSSQLCQGHCPIREIAAEHPVFCEEETAMFSRVLGVDLRRLSTQAAGDHVCTTHVPVGRQKLAAGARASVGSEQHTDNVTTPGRRRIVISPRQQERLS